MNRLMHRLCVLPCLFVLATPLRLLSAQGPDSLSGNVAISLDCTGDASRSLSTPPFKCSWQTTNARYVLIIGYSTEQQAKLGDIEFPSGALGPYFFMAVGRNGTALKAAGRTSKARSTSGAQAMHSDWNLDLSSAGRLAPYRESMPTGRSTLEVAQALVKVLQTLGYVVEEPEAPISPLGLVLTTAAEAPVLEVITTNSIAHRLLCVATEETDCAKPPGQRRLTRQMSVVVRLAKIGNAIELAFTPAVIKGFRRSGADLMPDEKGSAVAVPLCKAVANLLKASLGKQ